MLRDFLYQNCAAAGGESEWTNSYLHISQGRGPGKGFILCWTVWVTMSEEELGNGGMTKGFLLALILLDNFLLLLKAIKIGQGRFRKWNSSLSLFPVPGWHLMEGSLWIKAIFSISMLLVAEPGLPLKNTGKIRLFTAFSCLWSLL